MKITIDGTTIRTESDVHDLFASRLDFGPHYGRNLDALWDRLSTDVERPLTVVWRNSKASAAALGPDRFNKIREVLIKVMRQDESFGWDDRFAVRFE
jgi:ribonuclease inhibitor